MPKKVAASPCFALTVTSFAGRPLQSKALCRTRPAVPARVSIRRARATASGPDTDAASEADKSVDVINGADDAPDAATATPEEPAKLVTDDFADRVPGKITLDDIQLAQQRTALEQYSAELRKERIEEEREASRLFGWVPYAETLNGRLAMFFIVTGLLTEYWTGYNIPEQVELMARTLGIL